MRKIYLTILGISLISILSLGLNDSFKNQAVNVGDGGGAPSNAHGNGGGIVAKEI
ncbi:Phr family secreted Rap phosphatase inhibitor [Bacillus pseudomycoides]|uniref:Phr family secreted Rap phosphatase inhibitor n=1 Tax=Bacillus pseudomycoides TaxID=64104 RepID=A0A2B5HKG2_9BACI|nr:Phr family secreted Rap phosphatase inhibitor [Bacillus pseudomycoides]MED4653200.1 Phr family secreted Rap phosphatase inhibitor [Bacillus pseudomycoides]PEA82707.1 Phr family secreted Rap phosphatase inhibitor [Bacillus pseudomycoides]PED70166.1 Phr family secreted Rap phosphatase inhibitor [Bacillus pseudomycoides]PEE06863.1 Phr family secreted Rap phosphatase inhibitor [Bacillus pseudomycoides]PEI41411.1 Phr family secreted Rap phosphatase inhibitor [Bacillus pseudomycoides]